MGMQDQSTPSISQSDAQARSAQFAGDTSPMHDKSIASIAQSEAQVFTSHIIAMSPMDMLGKYSVALNDVPVYESRERSSKIISQLHQGHIVNVVEAASEPIDNRIRV